MLNFYSAACCLQTCCCLLLAAACWNISKFLQTGFYDGHRVDEVGNVVIRRPAVTALMKKFPQIDREKTGKPFSRIHALRTGKAGSHLSSRESRILIDGGPLAQLCTHHEPGVGRMSLADSANEKDKNMCDDAFTRSLHFFFVHTLITHSGENTLWKRLIWETTH